MAAREKFLGKPLEAKVFVGQLGSPTYAEVMALAYTGLGYKIPEDVKEALMGEAENEFDQMYFQEMVMGHNQLVDKIKSNGGYVMEIGRVTVMLLTEVLTRAGFVGSTELSEIKEQLLVRAVEDAAFELKVKGVS
ncbi:hypothetical protein A2876_03425 [Candidatus Amesbacteria bacterium RIFCSPHIGHO2_01_FULL_48_32b]|uniref:Uncharacterized protein n=1 Tax=Candidatus Amesbacteria bacterium RIFCSPHIGHO2_01_FULL_48_32b TaxID=1797253 RepID=A0A1F4YD99_9BACT|nr:MAG: hypothetical protein A2876_03425 [Candidatus Amesbacteria bacterium RIFCSPHIGHO2_01_FULL_48_32b]